MKKGVYQSKKLEPGDTIFLRNTELYSSPHCHALYLGSDATGDKVLLPTYIRGFIVANLDNIDPNAYRAVGRINLRSEKHSEQEPENYKYVFFDVVNKEVIERVVTVSKIENAWTIIEQPDEIPSWVE